MCIRDRYKTGFGNTFPDAADINPAVGIGTTVFTPGEFIEVDSVGAGATGYFRLGSGSNAVNGQQDILFEVAGLSTTPIVGDALGFTTVGMGFSDTNTYILRAVTNYVAGNNFTPTAGTYNPSTGNVQLTSNGHGMMVGDKIQLTPNSLTFTCAKDNHATTHSYPLSRSSVSGTWLPIHQVSTNRIWVNVGKSPDTSAHLFVSATAGVKKANAGIGIGTSKLGFKCTRDATDANPGGVAQQLYPRPGDPFSWNKKQISIASTTTSSITVNVGVSSTSHTNLEQHLIIQLL